MTAITTWICDDCRVTTTGLFPHRLRPPGWHERIDETSPERPLPIADICPNCITDGDRADIVLMEAALDCFCESNYLDDEA